MSSDKVFEWNFELMLLDSETIGLDIVTITAYDNHCTLTINTNGLEVTLSKSFDSLNLAEQYFRENYLPGDKSTFLDWSMAEIKNKPDGQDLRFFSSIQKARTKR